MPILNSIKIAEEQAQTLRREAEEKVRVLLEENRVAIELAVKSVDEAGEKARLNAEKTMLSDVDRFEKEIRKTTHEKTENLKTTAKKKTDEVAGFLLEKALKP